MQLAEEVTKCGHLQILADNMLTFIYVEDSVVGIPIKNKRNAGAVLQFP